MENKEGNFEGAFGKLTGEDIDKQIEQGVRGLGVACLAAIKEENGRLVSDLELLNDAITCHVIENWMSIWSAIDTLTDNDEICKLIEEVRPESKFHRNAVAVRKFVDCLKYWRAEEFLLNQDSLVKAFSILNERLADNIRFLQSYE
jgi:hypothetical protein